MLTHELHMPDFSVAVPVIEEKDVFVLTSHQNPDGDAMGSMLALYHFLTGKGKSVTMILPNGFPSYLSWMPGSSDILIAENRATKCRLACRNAEVIFALDYNSPKRFMPSTGWLAQSDGLKILIDHHVDPDTGSFSLVFSSTVVSSTAELVFSFIKAFGSNTIDRDIANCLYVGIVTDTGSFNYSCDQPETFAAVAELVQHGVVPSEINNLIYNTFSESRLRLLGYCISERLTVLANLSAAFIFLTKEDLLRFNHKTGDTEGFVNYALSVKGIKVAAIFIEHKDKIRISLRSKGDIPVNHMAKQHYQGGGHKNAAGGDSFDNMEVTLYKFETILTEYQHVINNY